MARLPYDRSRGPSGAVRVHPLAVSAVGAGGFALMRQLRPSLRSRRAFTAQLLRQSRDGYRLLAASRVGDARLVGLAGYRQCENLVHGRFLYVDDLVVDRSWRGLGIGRRLLAAMVEQAETKGCDALVLDTGLKNPARRLYDAFGLDASAVHYIGALAELSADHPAGDPSAASG